MNVFFLESPVSHDEDIDISELNEAVYSYESSYKDLIIESMQTEANAILNEGVAGTIWENLKKFFQKIIQFVKDLWSKISNFFKKLFGFNKKVTKDAQTVARETEAIEKKVIQKMKSQGSSSSQKSLSGSSQKALSGSEPQKAISGSAPKGLPSPEIRKREKNRQAIANYDGKKQLDYAEKTRQTQFSRKMTSAEREFKFNKSSNFAKAAQKQSKKDARKQVVAAKEKKMKTQIKNNKIAIQLDNGLFYKKNLLVESNWMIVMNPLERAIDEHMKFLNVLDKNASIGERELENAQQRLEMARHSTEGFLKNKSKARYTFTTTDLQAVANYFGRNAQNTIVKPMKSFQKALKTIQNEAQKGLQFVQKEDQSGAMGRQKTVNNMKIMTTDMNALVKGSGSVVKLFDSEIKRMTTLMDNWKNAHKKDVETGAGVAY